MCTLKNRSSKRVSFGLSVYIIAIFFSISAIATPPSSFMDGNLIVHSPKQGPTVLNFFGNLGSAVGDTAAQSLRFTSNIFRLDPVGAIGNIGNVFNNRSFDSILVQFAEKIPEVIEKGLHRTAKPRAAGTIGKYLSDGDLSTNEAAELLSYMMSSSSDGAADKESSLKMMEEMIQTLKSGSPGITAKEIGRRMGIGMKRAISAAPKPFPVLGAPMNKKRVLAIQKGFYHAFIQDLGPTYVRGSMKHTTAELKNKGLSISNLSDTQIRTIIDDSVKNLEFDRCYELARNTEDLAACAKLADIHQNRIIGQALATSTPWIRDGSVNFSLKLPGEDESRNLNPSLLKVIDRNRHAVQALRRNGDHQALNHLGNEAAREVTNSVGGEYVDQWVNENVEDPGKAHTLKDGSKTLINEFTKRVELIPGNTSDIKKHLADLGKGASLNEANNPLDKKMRKPFEDAIESKEGKRALLKMFLSQAPFNDPSKETFTAMYDDYLESGAWTLSLDPGLSSQLRFLMGFDQGISKLAKVPPSKSTFEHLRSIAALDSTTLSNSIMDLSNGTTSVFNYLTSCDPKFSNCYFLTKEYQDVINQIRDSRNALAASGEFPQCDKRFVGLAHKAFSFTQNKVKAVSQDPLLLIKAYKDNDSQEALNCYLAGLALKNKFSPKNTEQLFSLLESENKNNPGRRQRMIDELYGHLKNKTNSKGNEHKSNLLSLLQDSTRSIAKDYVDQNIDAHAKRNDIAAQVFAGTDGNKIAKELTHRFIDHTNIVDPNTDADLNAYMKQITSRSPTAANSHIDKALQTGLDSTLKDPQTRKDFLRLALEFNSPESTGKPGLLGPALEESLLTAYEGADFSEDPPRFPANTSKGVASVLRSFDHSVQTLSDRRGENESVLSFFGRVASPKSRILDSLLADNSQGITDLFMSMARCDGTNDSLCRGCFGTKGNWIIPDRKGGPPKILLSAPAGQVMKFLRLGMKPHFDRKITDKCRAAIPQFVESAMAQAGDPKNTSSVLRDPSNFLEALKKPGNQTAFNCIIASYAEKNVFADLRSKGIGLETLTRELLHKTGISKDSGLMNLTGGTLFETLERHNSNPKMIELKSNLIQSTRKLSQNDTHKNRHDLRNSTSDLITGSVLSTLSDPEFSHQILAGSDIPGVKLKARKNPWADVVLQCIERKYSESLMPLSLWAAEDVSSKFRGALSSWVDNAPDSRRRNPSTSPADAAAGKAAVEACARSSGPSVSATGGSGSSSKGPRIWVGGYKHTLKMQQELAAGQSRDVLTSKGQTRILERSGEYRTFLNHLQQRSQIVGRNKGATGWLGDRIFEIDHTAGEAAGVVNDLRKAVSFPEQKIISKLDDYISKPSSWNLGKLLKLLDKHCPSKSDYTRPPRPAVRAPEKADTPHQ